MNIRIKESTSKRLMNFIKGKKLTWDELLNHICDIAEENKNERKGN